MRGRIFGGRAFAHQLDLDDMSVRGAASASGERDAFAELIDQIPAPDFLRKRRKVGAAEVTDLAIPTLPAVSFALVDEVAVVGVHDHIEIWGRPEWEAHVSEIEGSVGDVAERAADRRG